jgi:murein L,D-transpeptidase YcbB/YkuD
MPTERVPMPDQFPYTQSLFMYLRNQEVLLMKEWLDDLNHAFKFSNKQLDLSSNYFGFETLQVVKDFQKFVGLKDTGIYDLATHTAMEWKQIEWKKAFQAQQQAAAKTQPAWVNQRKWW